MPIVSFFTKETTQIVRIDVTMEYRLRLVKPVKVATNVTRLNITNHKAEFKSI